MHLSRFAFFAATLLWTAPGTAATYYVAGNGSGTSCTVTSPCGSLTVALVFASANDTIVCLSPPPAGTVLIEKSITIDCTAARTNVRDGSGTGTGSNGATVGIVINVTGTYSNTVPPAKSDELRTVRLRGFNIDGGSSNGRNTDRGIEIQSAAVVHIESSVIQNYKQQGIYDHRAGGQTRLYIKDTVVSGNGGAGFVAASQGPAVAVLDNVSLLNNGYGIAAATGNNVVISRSTLSGNTTAGVHADGGAQINLMNSVLSHNTTNLKAFGTIRLRENDIQFSNVAIEGGSAVSMGGNRFSGNGTLGSTPTLASGSPSDVFH